MQEWLDTTTHRTDPPPPVLNSEMAIFGPGGHVHVRSRTEKRPSSRPLLLSNRPLFAVYMPYLLSYCEEYCVEKHKQLFHLLSFQAKGIALKTHKVLLPCSACLVHKEQRKEGIEDKRSAACRPVHSLARQRDRRRAAARSLCGVRCESRPCGRTDDQARAAFYLICVWPSALR